MAGKKQVLLVGHCDYDGPILEKFIESRFDAVAREIKTLGEATEYLESNPDEFSLILVNRVGAFDNKNGLELIDWVKNEGLHVPIMLLTNYEDKMNEAMEHGAVKGFGKQLLIGTKVSTDSENRAAGVLQQYLS